MAGSLRDLYDTDDHRADEVIGVRPGLPLRGKPGHPRPPRAAQQPAFQTNGLRLGTPALTTRGQREPEMRQVAAWIDRVMDAKGEASVCDAVRHDIRTFCASHPLPH